MGVVDGFWAGAYGCAPPMHWPSFVEKLGGWGALESCGAADLRAAGVSAELAQVWADPPVIRSWGIILTVADERYPSALRDVVGAPPLLFVEGDPGCLNRR